MTMDAVKTWGQPQERVSESIRLVRFLVKLLMLSFLLPEARLGPAGLIYPPPTVHGQVPTGLPFLFEVIIIVILVIFFGGVAIKVIRVEFQWYHRAVFVLIFFAIFAVLIAGASGITPDSSAFGHARMIFESLLLFLVVSSIRWRSKDLSDILWIFSLVGVFHAAVIIASYILPESSLPPIVNVIQTYPIKRYAGMFSQPSRASVLLSAAMAIQIAFLLARSALTRHTLRTLLAMVFLVIIFVGIWLSQTRAAYPALAAAAMIALGTRGTDKLRNLMLFVLVGLVIYGTVGSGDITEVGLERLNSGGVVVGVQTSALDEAGLLGPRGTIWDVTFQALLDFPLGMGFGAFYTYSGSYQLPHAHNMYLHWGVLFGIPAMVLLVYFLLRVLRTCSRRIRDEAGIDLQMNAIRLALVAYMISGLFEPFLITNVAFWFWLLLALAAAPVIYSGGKDAAPNHAG